MTGDGTTTHRSAKDLALGLFLVAISIGALYVNRDYEIGSASRMGPGYMPMLVFGLVGVFGVSLLVTGLRSGHDPVERWAWRELGLILSSLVVFAVCLNKLGLGLSVALLVMISSFADRTQTLKGAATLTAVLVALCWIVFDRGLKLGIPFLPPLLSAS